LPSGACRGASPSSIDARDGALRQRPMPAPGPLRWREGSRRAPVGAALEIALASPENNEPYAARLHVEPAGSIDIEKHVDHLSWTLIARSSGSFRIRATVRRGGAGALLSPALTLDFESE